MIVFVIMSFKLSSHWIHGGAISLSGKVMLPLVTP
jgi:hypothetical protein